MNELPSRDAGSHVTILRDDEPRMAGSVTAGAPGHLTRGEHDVVRAVGTETQKGIVILVLRPTRVEIGEGVTVLSAVVAR